MVLYYHHLFKQKDEFYKEDLIALEHILPNVIKRLIGEDNPFLSYGVLVLAAVIAWLTTLLGGIFEEVHSGSYFFHSCIFMVALFFGYDPMKESILRKWKFPVLDQIFRKDKAIIFGFGVMLTAANFAAWGVHGSYPQNVSFFWVFFNGLITIGLVLVKIIKIEGEVELEKPAEVPGDEDLNA